MKKPMPDRQSHDAYLLVARIPCKTNSSNRPMRTPTSSGMLFGVTKRFDSIGNVQMTAFHFGTRVLIPSSRLVD